MILLDTSFLVSYYNIRDENHQKALKITERILADEYGDSCISDYIFDECVTVIFNKLKDLQKTIRICEGIKKLKMLKIDEEIFEKSWQIFKNQKETDLSFTDSSSLAVMEKNKIKYISTFDDDFKKIKEIKIVN